MVTKRFRIAFSFAGEVRDFVEKVAGLLAARFGQDQILYDKYHEAEFARADLGIYLPKLYSEQSDLIVAVLSPAYDKKRWTGWEWLHIYSLLDTEDMARVMPCRFAFAQADGLSRAAAFVELDGRAEKEIADLILERLALNEGHPREHYCQPSPPVPAVSTTTIPNNLPSLQPFFGREDELKKIADSLDPDSRTWGALIDGPGGMGKTSLAVRAAYAVSPEVFHRIIFVSLKTRKLDAGGERDLSSFILSGLVELLNELARELGCPDIAKAPEDQRPRLLRDALRGTRTLLILDNLESLVKKDRDTVFTFVENRPPGCKAILTCRGRIGDVGMEITLDKLSEEAALATLAELATHNRDLARTSEAERRGLYIQSDGHPLLLRWTAGQLGRGHCLTFADALHFLRSCPEGNDPLEFIFGDLVADFSEHETKVICALTYFTLPAKVEHIVAIASLSEPETDRALRSLTVRSLAVPSDELQTFVLVPMVADFLRRKKRALIAETGRRLARRAHDLFVAHGYRQHLRFPLLETAWPTLGPALPIFAAGPNSQIQTMCEALEAFLNFTGRWDEQLSLSEQAEAKAVEAKDHANAGRRAFDSGWIYYLRRQGNAVLACAARAGTHWDAAGSGPRQQASAFQLRGIGHYLNANYSDAISAFREALRLDLALAAESEHVAFDLNWLSNAQKAFGDLAAAEHHYREALRVATAASYAEGVATSLGNLAGLALQREDWHGAETLAREALPLSEKLGSQELIAEDSRRLAQALARQGQPFEGLPYARRAVDIYSKLGSPDLTAARATLAECEGGSTSL